MDSNRHLIVLYAIQSFELKKKWCSAHTKPPTSLFIWYMLIGKLMKMDTQNNSLEEKMIFCIHKVGDFE